MVGIRTSRARSRRRALAAVVAGTLALGGAVVVVAAPVVPAPEAAAAPFECPAEGFLVQSAIPGLYSVDMVTGESSEIASNIFPVGVNGIGYNTLDGFVYGISADHDIVRIHDDGTTENLGQPAANGFGWPIAGNVNVGDFDENGVLWVANGATAGANNPNMPWRAIDLDPESDTYGQIVDGGLLSKPIPGAVAVFDWTFNPVDGYFYSVTRSTPQNQAVGLTRFDPSAGTIQVVRQMGVLRAPSGTLSGSTFGAVYADSEGFVYASSNTEGHIWRVDIAGNPEFFAQGPASGNNDGARCSSAPLPLDFGDAPASYGTTLADDGARHGLIDYDETTDTAPLMLGDANTVDAEADGVASPAADSDDTTGVDDEGAVSAPVTVTAGEETAVPVTATNDTGEPATLAAWLDADHSGTFDDDELVTATVPASSGTDDYSVTLPAAATGETFLRLRLFAGDVDDPSPTGPAAGGEVEDHPVVAEVSAEPPTCPVDAFLAQNTPTDLRGVDLVTGEVVDIAEDISGANLNALGFNPLDGDLYAINGNSFGLNRISTDGVVTGLGSIGLDQSARWLSGDFDADGHYWIAQGIQQQQALRWAEVDLAPGSATYGQVVATGSTPLQEYAFADWAYSLADGGLYTITNLLGTNDFVVVRFDTTTHTPSVVADLGTLQAPGQPPLGVDAGFGAIYADSGGNIYGSHNATGQIWRVNPTTLEASYFAPGPASADNDGARCVHAPVAVDLGDAPDSYGTILSADGARHGLESLSGTTSLMLGESVDAEDDGAPGPDADGDDTADLADEDGVADPIELTTGVEATVTVSATNDTDEAATLAGWVDLDRSGSFDDGELVTVAVPAGSGTADYELTFPGATVPGDSYARFRLFAGDVTDPSPTGAVSGGEVEDYPVTVQSEPLTCDALYALRGTSAPYDLLEVDTQTGALSAAYRFEGTGGTPNALGISADGRYAYGHWSTTVYVLDTQTATTEPFTTGQSVAATHGAVDPATGVYYYGNVSAGTAHVYGFDPATGTDLGQVATISVPSSPGDNGDWAFDSFGNLYLSTGDVGPNNLYIAPGPLPSTEQPSPVALTGRHIASISAGQPINGLAVDVAGYMYLSSSNTLFQVNPSSGQVVASPALAPTGLSVDLASCATPATIEVMKDVVDRRDPTDQFEVSITGGGIVDGLGNTGTTTGADTGLQDEEGEFGGPLMALVDETYTVTETAAGTTDLANYTTTWQCVNRTADDEVIAEGEGTQGEFTMPPASAAGIGAAVLCTFTNTDLPQPGLEITKTADPSGEVLPGGTVEYTVTVENTGETAYTALNPATFTDDLSEVLDDATYNDDVTADAGTPSYDEPELTWEGPLEQGETATVTYSVTVADPLTGDGTLTNAVVGPPESNCVDGGGGAPGDGCTTDVPVRALEISKTAEPDDEVLSGGTVEYTVSVTNTGQVAYTEDDPATFGDDLTDVLDDATWDDDADADAGEVTYAEPELSWSGALAPGDVATITYSVTVNDPPAGDGTLTNAVVGPPESSCAEGTEEGCATDVPVRALEIVKSSDPEDQALPGGTVEYAVTVTNTGQVPYTEDSPATMTDDLAQVLDDATWNGDAAADVGATSYAEPILSWSGPLPVGETATITYSVTVNDPLTGDGTLTNAVVGPPESGCVDGTEPGCSTAVPIRDLEIVKTADPADEVLPGGVVEYTVTVTNTGQVPYTDADPATFDDDLTNVLDDATYEDDASADVGEVTSAGPGLSWSGPLGPGETATVTYSVTVNDPLTGDGVLTNAVVGPPESGCVDGTEPGCRTDAPVRALHLVKMADGADDALPGDIVTYTITVTNTGQVPYTDDAPASFDDDLTEVLDDATYDDDASADVGEVSYAEPTLTWSGPLEPGQTATITYAVTVNDPATGDGEMFNVVVGPEESNCTDRSPEPATADPDCVEPDPIRALEITKTADPAGEVLPGGTVEYTVTVENTGQVGYGADGPASFIDDLSDVLDDATWNSDAVADVGAVSYGEPILSWSGPLDPGEVATVTYSVTVDEPPSGDGMLTNAVVGPDESNCEDGSDDPGCDTVVPVRALHLEKMSDGAEGARPGDTITYTVTATNIGQVAYTEDEPASFDDDLTEVLDDAVFNDDASADVGETSYSEPILTWTGALEPGEVATISYTVTLNDPPSGDENVFNVILGPDESNCTDPESDDPDCIEPDPVKDLEILKTADPEGPVTVGDTVTYSVAVTNTGTGDYTADDPAFFTDVMEGVLDDAVYNDDVAADVGEASFDDGEVSWTGPLPAGETATVTYSVTVNDPISGDGTLANAVLGPQESNCPVVMPGGGGGMALGVAMAVPQMPPGCQVVTPVRSFEVAKSVDVTVADPGDVVTYTVTVTSTGTAPYTDDVPAGFSDDLSDVLDDATPAGTPSASAGELVYAEPVLSWRGPLEVGGTVTVTYSLTVDDPDEGDGTLVNVVTPADGSGGHCTSGDACTTSTDVVPPHAPAPGPTPPAPGPGVLPRTGPEWIGALLAAALFLVVGGGLMLRLRPRRES